MNALQVAWFFLIGILLTAYAILDGFDLGVGFWYLFNKKDEDRRLLLNAIGPVWDGNEVWLVTGGAALFAAFPPVYATVFSGFYLAIMLIVFALIFRAVSIEFRSKVASPRWRQAWDGAFWAGSILPALLFPVAIGNLLAGIPMDHQGNYTGSFFTLLSPYALLIGFTGFAMLLTHGALYIVLKTEGDLHERAAGWAQKAWYGTILFFVASSLMTITAFGQRFENFKTFPALWIVVLFAVAAMGATGFFIRKRDAVKAFAASSLSIAGLMGIFGASVFPALVPAAGGSENALTIMNASSSPLTLQTMLIISLMGLPIVIGYTVWIYRTFKGKVRTDHLEY